MGILQNILQDILRFLQGILRDPSFWNLISQLSFWLMIVASIAAVGLWIRGRRSITRTPDVKKEKLPDAVARRATQKTREVFRLYPEEAEPQPTKIGTQFRSPQPPRDEAVASKTSRLVIGSADWSPNSIKRLEKDENITRVIKPQKFSEIPSAPPKSGLHKIINDAAASVVHLPSGIWMEVPVEVALEIVEMEMRRSGRS